MRRATKDEIEVAKKEREANIADFISKNTVESNYLKLIPKSMQNTFYQIFSGKNSMKMAIKGKCIDCSCFQKDEIKKCGVTTCTLYNFRPYK